MLAPNTETGGLYPSVYGRKPKRKEEITMPLPSPNSGESQDAFISRAMGNKVMQNEYKDKKQRLAVAYSQWRRSRKEEVNPMSDPGLYIPLREVFDRWYNEVFSKGKFSNRSRSEGCLKDKSKQTIKADIDSRGDGKTPTSPDKKLAPHYPDEGANRLWNENKIKPVQVYEVPEKSQSEFFKKAQEEIKQEYDKMLNKIERKTMREEGAVETLPPVKTEETISIPPGVKKTEDSK